MRGQVGYCILHNGRMCSALETRYLGIRERCLAMARTLSALSYEAQAPLKMRSRSLSSAHACESVNAYLQVTAHSCITFGTPHDTAQLCHTRQWCPYSFECPRGGTAWTIA